MRRRRLGSSDLEVSEIALGSWLTYGQSVERSRAEACVRRALDLGVNFFDTANMYGRGAAESFLGEVLVSVPRGEYVLATKVYFPMSDTDRGLSREQIHKQLDASLERLRTDYVDLYQCHRYDVDTPLEETMQALTEVVAAGKARYVGFSQWKPRQIRAAYALADTVRFVSSQPRYSMLDRRPERRLFPTCDELGIGQVVYSPLAQGVLTGKYAPDRPVPENSRAANPELGRTSKRFFDPAILGAVARLGPIAESLGLSTAQLALSWVLRDSRVTAAIIGASRPEQVEHNIVAAEIDLDQATLDAVDRALGDVVRR